MMTQIPCRAGTSRHCKRGGWPAHGVARWLWFALVWIAAGAQQALAVPLALPVSSVTCVTHGVGTFETVTDASACSLGSGALSSSGSVVGAPFVSLVGQVSAFGFPVNLVGASVSASLDYEFQVIGGNPGDVVPILIATQLDTVGRNGVSSWGFASINIDNVFGLGVGASACTPGGSSCFPGGPSFHDVLSVLMKSGGSNGTVHLAITAFAGSSLIDEFASASADPYIFVDPSFPDAGLYSIAVSPGVSNAVLAVPEPSPAALLSLGLLAVWLTKRLPACRWVAALRAPR